MLYYQWFVGIGIFSFSCNVARYFVQLLLCNFRNRFNGDKTSRIFEDKAPSAMPGEKEQVNQWFWMYKICYSIFDSLFIKWTNTKYAKHFQSGL